MGEKEEQRERGGREGMRVCDEAGVEMRSG